MASLLSLLVLLHAGIICIVHNNQAWPLAQVLAHKLRELDLRRTGIPSTSCPQVLCKCEGS